MALKVKTYNNVQANVTFSKASSRVEINPTAGEAATENIALTLGKISKWYDSLVPTGGSSGKILVYNSSGTAKWNDPLHPTITKSADTTSTASPAHGGTFTTVDSVTRDANGHVTKINTKTVTLPSDQNTDTKVNVTLATTTKAYLLGTSTTPTGTAQAVTSLADTGVYLDTTAGRLTTGSLWSNGDITLYTSGTGNSPAIFFRRGTLIDSSLDWKLYDTEGRLHFDRNISGSTESWENILKLDPTNSKMYFKNTEVSLAGHTHNYVPNTQAGMNAAINLLGTGTSDPQLADYYIAQYAGGGTTTTTYHRRPISALWNTFRELITCEVTGDGNAVTTGSFSNDGNNRKLTLTKGSTFSLSNHTHTTLNVGNKGSATNPVYFSSGAPTACTYSLGSTVNAGTAKRLAYFSGANAVSATGFAAYDEIDSTASTPVTRRILHLFGAGVGNTAAELISGTAGLLSYGDGGPQINFNTASSLTIGGGQDGALIFTDHDTAASGVSWHFVSNQTDWNVISKRFHARTSISIGTNLPNTSYNLYVNGTTNITGATTIGNTTTISTSSFGTQLIVERSGSANMAAVGFKNSSGVLGYVAAGTVDGDLFHYGADTSKKYTILDSNNTSFTRALTSGTKIGTIKIAGTSTDIYCQTNSNTTYTLGTSGDNVTLTPSSGSVQSITVPYATNANLLKYTHTNEINFSGGKQAICYFNYRDADTNAEDTGETPVSINYKFCDYRNSTAYTTITAANFAGNASTATKWKTARTLTIGSTGKSVDGSGNVSWSLSEIGAAAASHTHDSLEMKALTASTIDTTAGSFVFGGTDLIGNASYDWAGIQVDATNDSFQLTANGQLIFRQNDNNSKTSENWGEWKGCLTTSDVVGSGGITVTQNDITIGSGEGAYTYKGAVTISHSNSIAQQSSTVFKKFSYDSHGHITDIANVAKSDITALGIPAQDTKYGISGAYGSNNNTWVTTITAGGSGTTSTVPTASTSVYGITKLYNGVDSTSTGLAATANAVKTAYDKANHSHPYLPLAGGTLTGALTLKGEQYSGNYGLDCANSDVIGVNSLRFADSSGNYTEGISFPRTTADHWDTIWANGGEFYFTPDHETDVAGATSYKVLHTNNTSFSRSLTSGTKIGSITIAGTSTDIYAPTAPTVNNASLTLKGSGTTVTTFTANASTNQSLDIVAGSNVTITPDATNHKITIASSYTNTDEKVKVTLKTTTTTKAYLLGTSTTPTSSAQPVTSIADTGVYLGTGAGSLYATTFYENGTALSSKYAALSHSHDNLTSKALTASTFDSTSGNFFFKGSSLFGGTDTYDWVGIQADVSNDKFQLVSAGANGVYYRAEDDSTGWSDWYSLLTNAMISGSSGITVTPSTIKIGGDSGTTVNTGVTIAHSNSITAVTTVGFYKFKFDAQGHITGTADVSPGDIPPLNYSKVSISRNLTSGTKVGTITIDGTATDLYCQTNTDVNVTQTATTTNADYEVLFSATADNTTRTETARKNSNLKFNPSTGSLYASKYYGEFECLNEVADDTSYAMVLAANPATHQPNTLRKTPNVVISFKNGTASEEGWTQITLGNSTPSGTAGNETGWLKLYSPNSGVHYITGASTTSAITHTLPTVSGTILNSGTTSFTQSLSSGTKIGSIKINGTSTDIYAPTNTDTKVTQTVSTSDNTSFRPLLLGASWFNEGGAPSTVTDTVMASHRCYIKPSTGDITLYSPSGDSPGLIFKRGTNTDNLNDWKIYDKAGMLYFARNTSGSSAWTDYIYFDKSTINAHDVKLDGGGNGGITINYDSSVSNYSGINYKVGDVIQSQFGWYRPSSGAGAYYYFGGILGDTRVYDDQFYSKKYTVASSSSTSYNTAITGSFTANRTITIPDATGTIPLITEIYNNPSSTATSQTITNASQYKFFIISAKLSDANHFDETTAIIPMPSTTGEVRKNINFMMPVGTNTETRLLNGAIVINYSSSSCVISGVVAGRYLLAATSSSTASSISTGTMSVYITRIVGISY